jgi:hypothetical protein
MRQTLKPYIGMMSKRKTSDIYTVHIESHSKSKVANMASANLSGRGLLDKKERDESRSH